jgi:hypothetical protein
VGGVESTSTSSLQPLYAASGMTMRDAAIVHVKEAGLVLMAQTIHEEATTNQCRRWDELRLRAKAETPVTTRERYHPDGTTWRRRSGPRSSGNRPRNRSPPRDER